jgi:hypothetical protein
VFIGLILLIVPLSSSTLSAQVAIRTDLLSNYIWRGFDLNPYQEPVLQPQIGYRFGDSGLAIDTWSSFSFKDKEVNEFRAILKYRRYLTDSLCLEGGFIHYGWYFAPEFQFKDDTSHEFYLTAGFPDFFLRPSLTTYYDFTNGDGFYFLLDGRYSLKLLDWIGADLHVSLGYNAGQWLAEGVDPGFSDLNLGLSLPIALGRFKFSPLAVYTAVLLDAIGKDDFLWYGISVVYE